MKSKLLLAACFLTFSSAIHAQAPCAAGVSVSAPDSRMQGEDLSFTANLTGTADDDNPTYNWTVSSGSISSGQGTPSIVLETKEMKAGETVTATVEVGGVTGCMFLSNSATTGITAAPKKTRGRR